MIRILEGQLKAETQWKVALVASRFNEFITRKLVDGAIDCLVRSGLAEEKIDLVWVPGAFELPAVASKLAKSNRYNGLICLGAVIRGATPHFDMVAAENAKGIASVAAESGLPVIYSVLTTDTIEQAVERAGTKAGNKGFDSARSLIEMISLYKRLEQD